VIPRLRMCFEKLKSLFRSQQPDLEFDEEMRAHMSLHTARNIREGMSPKDAAAAARRQFGNLLLLQEDRKEMRGLPIIESMWRSVSIR
jgi:hypothetical protein